MLSPRHKAVLEEYLVNGNKGAKAWQKVHPDTPLEHCASNMSLLLRRDDAQNYINEIRGAPVAAKLMDVIQRRKLLAEIAMTDPRRALTDAPHIVQRVKVTRRITAEGETEETMDVHLPNKIQAIQLDDVLSGDAVARSKGGAEEGSLPAVDGILAGLLGVTDTQAAS